MYQVLNAKWRRSFILWNILNHYAVRLQTWTAWGRSQEHERDDGQNSAVIIIGRELTFLFLSKYSAWEPFPHCPHLMEHVSLLCFRDVIIIIIIVIKGSLEKSWCYNNTQKLVSSVDRMRSLLSCNRTHLALSRLSTLKSEDCKPTLNDKMWREVYRRCCVTCSRRGLLVKGKF